MEKIKCENEELILSGKICPYCGRETVYTDSCIIYGKSYGMIYYCKPCLAWVGVHRGTNKALGRLANAELREWKKKAHEYFDRLWVYKMRVGKWSKNQARQVAYRWLSDTMKIPFEKTHIGMFDVEQCKTVVDLCSKYWKV